MVITRQALGEKQTSEDDGGREKKGKKAGKLPKSTNQNDHLWHRLNTTVWT